MSIEGIQEGYLFGQKWYVKRVRVAQGEASPYKTPPPGSKQYKQALGHQYLGLFFNPSPTNAF